jgi:hypothetical protein
MAAPRTLVAGALTTAAALIFAFCLRAQNAPAPKTIGQQLSTPERIHKHVWWPTKGTARRDDFVGTATCAQCHASLAAGQTRHAMANTAIRPADSAILKAHPLDMTLGPYAYRIVADKGKPGFTYSVSDGQQSISGPLSWAFGVGRMGQSFLFERNGAIYLVPYTFYQGPQKYDFTVDQSHAVPDSLERAIGRPLGQDEIRGCFGCHTTASTTEGVFDISKLIPSVTCEQCHGPGKNHVALSKAGLNEEAKSQIFNPRQLDPVASMDFCGACHRTWWDVTLSDSGGLKSVRFQPYRIENSRCWGKGDTRLTCEACHDPHQPLVQESAYYDKSCLSCHVTGKDKPTADHPGAACPQATKDCVDCHMPKYKVAEVYFKFTDHMIRVVKPGEAFPE